MNGDCRYDQLHTTGRYTRPRCKPGAAERRSQTFFAYLESIRQP